MFITLEGIEGSGKTTQMPAIKKYLEENGHDVVMTREPGATKIGQKIRSILLDPQNHALSPVCELLLYSADRAQHLFEVILPALHAGKTVLCDRFADATTAYQGSARGLDGVMIETLYEMVSGKYSHTLSSGDKDGGDAVDAMDTVNAMDAVSELEESRRFDLHHASLKPDVTILFDLDPIEGLKRAAHALEGGERQHEESRFEQEAVAFHERVRQGYLDIAQNDRGRFVVVDASRDRASVFNDIVMKLSHRQGVIPSVLS